MSGQGRAHQAREDFAKLIANRNVRLSLNGVATWRDSEPGHCYLHADGVFVGAVEHESFDIVTSAGTEPVEDGGLWSATLEARKISHTITGVPDCFPYGVGDEHMTMWDALTTMLLEHDWRTGATSRVGRPEKRAM